MHSLIIAHRGASYNAPENTLASFRMGLEQGAHAIECDIHLSLDNELVVIHDSTLLRTTGVNGTARSYPLAKLKSLDAGSWKDPIFKNERIPILEEVFDILPFDRKIFIEIKSGEDTAGPLRELMKKDILSPSQMVLMDFDLNTAIHLKRNFPFIEVIWLYGFSRTSSFQSVLRELEKLPAIALSNRLDGIGIQNVSELDKGFFKMCRSAQLKSYCWTVNDPDRAYWLMENGIDGIITDRPQWIREKIKNPSVDNNGQIQFLP